MELWIRSQNKLSLTKINSVVIDYNDQKKIVANYMEFNGSEDYTPLGEYDIEERALEVLDEIQNLLQPKIKYIQEEPIESIMDFGYQITQNVDMKIQEINRIVYNMPKE